MSLSKNILNKKKINNFFALYLISEYIEFVYKNTLYSIENC